MINCAILVLFAMRAAKLMKKRSGICLANIHSIRLSQRSHARRRVLTASLLLALHKQPYYQQIRKQTDKGPSQDTRGGALGPRRQLCHTRPVARVGLRCQRARLIRNEKNKRQRRQTAGEQLGRREEENAGKATRRADLFCFFLPARRNATGHPIRGLRLAHPPWRSGGSTLHARQADSTEHGGPANEAN